MFPSRPSVVIVGHGSSISDGAHEAANQHALTLRQSNRYGTVDVSFLASQSEPHDLPKGEIFLLPFFMSDGYFVKKRIPEEFGLTRGERREEERHLFLCEALGVDPELSGIIAVMGQEACRKHSWQEREVHLVLVAHGSEKSRASAEATELQRQAVEKTGMFRSVVAAFLNEKPGVAEILDRLAAVPGPVVVVGLFAAEGPHAVQDVPEEIGIWQATSAAPKLVHYAGVVGVRPEIVRLIQHSISRCAARA